MLKKILMAAMAVAALAAVAAPNVSATITHNEKGVHTPLEEGEEPHETFTGEAEFQSGELGGAACKEVEGEIQLNTAPTTGTVTKFQVKEPTVNCTVSGALAAICGVKSLHQVNLTHHAHATVVTNATKEDVITIQTIKLFNLFGSTLSPCIPLELESTDNVAGIDVVANPDDATEISTVDLSGELHTEFGPVKVDGTLHAHNEGTYGIEAI
jgi:hypothetical protein